jgi:hypothetical protein
MSDKNIADKLLESTDAELLTPETKEQVNSMIEAKVEARLAEATKQLKDKEKNLKAWLEEQNRQLKEKEAALEEVAESFAKQCADEMTQKEAIMFESLQELKQRSEEIVAESCEEFKKNILETTLQECVEYKSAIEEETITHISEYKKLQEAALAKEVDNAKATIVDRMSKYLDTKVQDAIPAKVMEAAVEAAAYRPLVESMIKTFAQGYVKFDSTGYTAIKEAKAEALRLSESVTAKSKDNVRLAAKVKELERSQKILSLCESLTAKQRVQAKILLEKVETDNLDEAFNKMKKNLIEESVRVQPQAQKITESAKKQLEKIQESVIAPDAPEASDVSSEISSWAKDLNRNYEK